MFPPNSEYVSFSIPCRTHLEKSFHFDCQSGKTSYIALNNVENCDILVIQMAAEAAYLKYHTYRRERWKEKIMEGTNDRGALTLKFPVQSFRKIPNPYLKEEEGDKEAAMYVAICDVKELPADIPMETNPREQKLTTNVAKKIKNSLLDPAAFDFYLLNRGLLLSARTVTFDNYSNQVTIVFEDPDVHGNVDGGHTYKIILANRDQLDLGQQYVKLEILTGVENIFQNLAAARNTSVQVQDKSIAELEKRFEIIKDAIGSEGFSKRVYFKENDSGDIDVADLLAMLNMFNIHKYPGKENFPVVSYSAKKKCIDYYIEYHKKFGESAENPYVKMVPIMCDIFKLYDRIEISMSRFYRQKNQSGRYGSVKGVAAPKGGRSLESKFYGKQLDLYSPTGFLYPILGAFRALVKEENGVYGWKTDPFAVLERVGGELVETTVERSRSLGNNPQSVGKDSGNWKTLYITVMFDMMEL